VHYAVPANAPQLEWYGEAGKAKQGSSLAEGTAPDPEPEDEELSDLDDSEAGMYLHTEEEAKLKEVIWTELNRDFLDKQQVKAAAAAEHARKACSAIAFTRICIIHAICNIKSPAVASSSRLLQKSCALP